jgi:hypothetical protein
VREAVDRRGRGGFTARAAATTRVRAFSSTRSSASGARRPERRPRVSAGSRRAISASASSSALSPENAVAITRPVDTSACASANDVAERGDRARYVCAPAFEHLLFDDACPASRRAPRRGARA